MSSSSIHSPATVRQISIQSNKTTNKQKNGFTLLSTDESDIINNDSILDIPSRTRQSSIIPLSVQSVIIDSTKQSSSSYVGIIYVAGSALMFSLMSLFVSLSASTEQHISSFEILTVRSIIQSLCAFISCVVYKQNPFGNTGYRLWLLARGIVGIVSMSCLYYSVTALGVADATVLFFISPIWAILLARCLLHEEMTMFDLCCAIGSIIGCIFVARPSFIFPSTDPQTTQINDGMTRSFAVFIALCGSFLSGMVYILIRQISHNAHPQQLVFCTGFAGVIYGPLALYFLQPYIPPSQWNMDTTVYMALVGVCAYIGQCLFNSGVQREKAGIASITRNLDVVFVFLWQITILQQSINIMSIIGAVIMTCSVCAVGIRKVIKNRQEQDR